MAPTRLTSSGVTKSLSAERAAALAELSARCAGDDDDDPTTDALAEAERLVITRDGCDGEGDDAGAHALQHRGHEAVGLGELLALFGPAPVIFLAVGVVAAVLGGLGLIERRVELNDETLRDGLQSPSVRTPSIEAKLAILHEMVALGIDALDLGLADMNGFTLLEKIKENPDWENLPVIVYTGRDLSPAEETQLRRYAGYQPPLTLPTSPAASSAM